MPGLSRKIRDSKGFFMRRQSSESRGKGWLRRAAVAAAGVLFAGGAVVAAPTDKPISSTWLGEELPLPLAVKTPQDLALKAVAERQYLVFNLLARGKLAWDAGDFATAAAKWEQLLRIPGIDPELDKVLRPLAADARSRAGGNAALPSEAAEAPAVAAAAAVPAGRGGGGPVVPMVSVAGQVSGGGALGPGGAVVWLKRAAGSTPRPSPVRGKSFNQVNKTFVPRVLPVTVGSTVSFNNQDPIFHNVFSLSRPNDFDSGLYKAGQSYSKTFSKAGAVQVLCNIHASMLGYVVVVDSPWYGQADGRGNFTIRGVPPGDYDLETWHEASSQILRQKITVGSDGLRGVAVRVSGDKRAPSTVPDKYGKDRQVQLGY
jgi:plastocyanin